MAEQQVARPWIPLLELTIGHPPTFSLQWSFAWPRYHLLPVLVTTKTVILQVLRSIVDWVAHLKTSCIRPDPGKSGFLTSVLAPTFSRGSNLLCFSARLRTLFGKLVRLGPSLHSFVQMVARERRLWSPSKTSPDSKAYPPNLSTPSYRNPGAQDTIPPWFSWSVLRNFVLWRAVVRHRFHKVKFLMTIYQRKNCMDSPLLTQAPNSMAYQQPSALSTTNYLELAISQNHQA